MHSMNHNFLQEEGTTGRTAAQQILQQRKINNSNSFKTYSIFSIKYIRKENLNLGHLNKSNKNFKLNRIQNNTKTKNCSIFL